MNYSMKLRSDSVHAYSFNHMKQRPNPNSWMTASSAASDRNTHTSCMRWELVHSQIFQIPDSQLYNGSLHPSPPLVGCGIRTNISKPVRDSCIRFRRGVRTRATCSQASENRTNRHTTSPWD